jgi:uncharacterized protein YqgC (DUF456 family)
MAAFDGTVVGAFIGVGGVMVGVLLTVLKDTIIERKKFLGGRRQLARALPAEAQTLQEYCG